MQFLKKVGFILWFIILFIWQLPQNLVALVMLPFLGKLRLISFKKMNFCFEGSYMLGGISLGTFSYVSKSLAKRKANVKHEQEGHTVDSKRWGPLYLFVIGIPSLLWAGFGDEVFENIHPFKNGEKRIKKLHKQLSKKKKGSNNREKARIKLARAYERITAQREAYLHKIANTLLSEYDVIFIEDLNVEGMMKNHHLAKAIQELGLGKFGEILKDKASLNGKMVVEVDRWYPSSKTCHKCGYVYKDLTLNERMWKCPVCGEVHDRDKNAALNILEEGKRIIGLRKPESTPDGEPSCGRPFEKLNLRSSGLMKQEEGSKRFS